jgi:hypothetical protein
MSSSHRIPLAENRKNTHHNARWYVIWHKQDCIELERVKNIKCYEIFPPSPRWNPKWEIVRFSVRCLMINDIYLTLFQFHKQSRTPSISIQSRSPGIIAHSILQLSTLTKKGRRCEESSETTSLVLERSCCDVESLNLLTTAEKWH